MRTMHKKIVAAGEVRQVDSERRRIVGIGSQEVLDREGDIIRIDGLDTANFERNPVLLANHDHGFPLGRVTALRIERRENVPTLVFEAEILPAGTSPRVDETWAAIAGGARNGVSIGFTPRQIEPIPGTRGVIFTRAELLEVSSVCLPACPACLAQAKSICACGGQSLCDDEVVLELADGPVDGDDPVVTMRRSDLTAAIREAVGPLTVQLRELRATLGHRRDDADTGLLLDDDPADLLVIGDDDLRALPSMIASGVRAALGTLVQRELTVALDRARGRID